ncbi:hypothetical protein BJ742DRAFT_19511 [Cladochytrium replicatum]|nr:hypothetical protein BJ742DRAFT_19511 [Cladochytrium replicatum]
MLAMCRLESGQLPTHLLDPPPSCWSKFANVQIDSVLKGHDKSQRDELVDAANARALEPTDVYELRLTLSEDEAALHSLWSDPKNWIFGFYYCPADPRIVVPKRNSYTSSCQTINFANRTPEAKKWMSGNKVLRKAYKNLIRNSKSGSRT